MTSAPSQSSGQPAAKKAASQLHARRLQILAALDIDVWAQRSSAPAPAPAPDIDVEVSTDSTQPGAAVAPAQAPVRKLPAGAGPAEALALLEASSRPGSAREMPSAAASVAAPASANSAEAMPVAAPASESSAPTAGSVQRVDLLCLTGKHGLLLTRHEGLGPQAQRLLQDILQSATRAIGARLDAAITTDEPAKPTRIKLKSLRFTWPPEVQGGSETDGDTARALRGFLNRQLKEASEPVVIYVADQLAQLLDTIDLPVGPERLVAIGSPEALMSDSSAKRALWRTLSTL